MMSYYSLLMLYKETNRSFILQVPFLTHTKKINLQYNKNVGCSCT